MKKTIIILLAVLILGICGNALAQFENYDSQQFKFKSETAALQYSIAGTLIPIVTGLATGESIYQAARIPLGDRISFISLGILVGPSLGYFYAEEAKSGLKGIGIRLCIETVAFITMMHPYIGLFFVMAYTTYNISTVQDVVQHHNLELICKNQTSVTLMPKYFADSGAGGVELKITF